MNLLLFLSIQGTKMQTILDGIWADVCKDHLAYSNLKNQVEIVNTIDGSVKVLPKLPKGTPQYVRCNYFDRNVFVACTNGEQNQRVYFWNPRIEAWIDFGTCHGVYPVDLSDGVGYFTRYPTVVQQLDWESGSWDYSKQFSIPSTSQGIWDCSPTSFTLTDEARNSVPGFLYPTLFPTFTIGQSPAPDFLKLKDKDNQEYNLFDELCNEPRASLNSNGSYSICARLLNNRVLLIVGTPPFGGKLITPEQDDEMKPPKINVLEYSSELKKGQNNTLVRYRDTGNNQTVTIELQSNGNLRVSHQIDGVGFDRTGKERIVKW